VICPNVLGSCMGTTGPGSIAPDGQPYGLRFPVITIRDMVRAHVMLLDAGVDKLYAVMGGSMGGMQALSLAVNWPEWRARAGAGQHGGDAGAEHRLSGAGPSGDHGRSQLAGRRLLRHRRSPDAGLAVARMAAHITYLSEATLSEKFGRRLQDRQAKSFGFGADFRWKAICAIRAKASPGVSTPTLPLHHQGDELFRSDRRHGGDHRAAWPRPSGCCARALVASHFDWLYPTSESRSIAHALNAAGAPVSFMELAAPFGHDSFLLDVPALDRVIEGFLLR
jgi:homoserine O-acetyltransferase